MEQKRINQKKLEKDYQLFFRLLARDKGGEGILDYL